MSIVVCTRDRPLAVADVLRDVVAQAPADADVVLIDQSEPDGVAANAAAVAAVGDGRVRHLPTSTRGLATARNEGVDATHGAVVLFLDDDVRLRPGCVDAHLAAYDDPWVGGVVGRIEERTLAPNARRVRNDVGPGGRVRTNLDGDEAVDVGTLKGANMSYRRVALRAAGPADASYDGTAFLEDADWSTRVRALGWRLRFVPEAALVHLALPSGGCRVGSAEEAEAARFRNTGAFVRRHRPLTAPLVAVTFAGIAAKRAAAWGSPGAAARLLGALVEGWRRGGT